MVGTNATRCPSRRQARTRSRTAAMVVTVSMVTGTQCSGAGILARLHRTHVALQRLEVVAAPSMKLRTKRGLRPVVMSSMS